MKCLCFAVLVCAWASAPAADFAPPADPAITEQQPKALPPVDPVTGRLSATWRKDQPIDYTHLRLEVDFPDATVAALTGVVTLEGVVRGLSVPVVVLDCDGPSPIAASINGSAVAWALEGKQIRLTPKVALAPGAKVKVQVKYTLDFAAAKGEGLTLSPPVDEPANATDRSPVIHAQGQAELNSRWFPCPDTPAERLTSEVIATMDAGLDVLSNGTLVSSKRAAPGSLGQARTMWHWSQRQPHAPYLITLVAGDFATIDLGGRQSARPGLAMPVYVPHGDEEFAQQLFANTPAMVKFLEERFDEKYPWDKYAQAVVRGFRWGGMENTSLTVLTPSCLRREHDGEPIDPATGPMDDLIMHELAHQWMGDLVTCRHWDHTWLNEGWATYCEALWAREHAQMRGEDAEDAYLQTIANWLRGQIVHNDGVAPRAPAMASNRYVHPDDVFERVDDPYAKGALVLHMLHEMLGEKVFWTGTRAYIDRWKFDQPESSDFRRELEKASGRSLERFFDQWLTRPGMPRLRARSTWDASRGELTIALEQTQTIDAMNPAYALRMPIVITMEDGTTQDASCELDTRTGEVRVPLAAPPVSVAVDPRLTIMATVEPRFYDLRAGVALESAVDAPPTPEELKHDAEDATSPEDQAAPSAAQP